MLQVLLINYRELFPPFYSLQALQYLKKVCNHPALVLQNSKHPQHEKMIAESKAKGKAITDIEYSAKLSALK